MIDASLSPLKVVMAAVEILLCGWVDGGVALVSVVVRYPVLPGEFSEI